MPPGAPRHRPSHTDFVIGWSCSLGPTRAAALDVAKECGRVAFDPVGGPGFPKLISALAFGGIIYIYGLLGTGVTPLPVLEMIAKVATIKAHKMSLTSGDETRRKAAIEFVVKGLQAGALKPVIDRTFTFDEMADVHRYLEQGGQFGKIVVTV
jgi:NADPH:quinone reductase-like Zn-dependent oxidoreductase